jgi:uncharacterized membrane protein
MSDLWLQAALSFVNFLHLLATVTWIGGMATNILVMLPSAREVLEPAVFGRFLGAVMKRFRLVSYGSIVILVIAGVLISLLSGDSFDSAPSQVIIVKHLFVIVLVLLAVYSFEVLAPKVAKLVAKGPSPELLKAQKLQLRLASTGFVLGLIILLLAAIALSL